jgi:hypothetical protein
MRLSEMLQFSGLSVPPPACLRTSLSRVVIDLVAAGDFDWPGRRRRNPVAAAGGLPRFARRRQVLAHGNCDEFGGVSDPGSFDGPRDLPLDLAL